MSFVSSPAKFKCKLSIGEREKETFRVVFWNWGSYDRFSYHRFGTKTLAHQLKEVYPCIDTPFQVVVKDFDGDEVPIDIDRVSETIRALEYFGYSSTNLIRITIKLPSDLKILTTPLYRSLTLDCIKSSESTELTKITEKLDHLEITFQTLGQRIISLLEGTNEILKINSDTQRNKHNETPSLSLEAAKLSLDMVDEQILEQPRVEVTPPKSSPLSTTKDCNKDEREAHKVTLNPSSIGVSSSPTPLLEKEVVDISTYSPPSRSSSSSSLQTVSSLADEWTRIEDETSRRRNLTGSSCASNSSSEHSNDVFSMEDELRSMSVSLCREP